MGDFDGYGDGGGGYGSYGGGGSGGGGYMGAATSSGSGGSPSKEGGRGGNAANNLTFPVMVSNLQSWPATPSEDAVMVPNTSQAVGRVELYGRVVSVANKETNTTYVLDDGTGQIEASQWNDQGNPVAPPPVGTNVCVHGGVRFFNGVRHVDMHHIRVVTDPNEFEHHKLEVRFAVLQAEKGPLNDGSKIIAQSAASSSGAFGGPTSFYNPTGASSVYQDPAAGSDGFTALDRLVLQEVSNDTTEEGMDVKTCAMRLRSKGFTLQQIKDSCQKLSVAGQLYSSIDEDHFKSTGATLY